MLLNVNNKCNFFPRFNKTYGNNREIVPKSKVVEKRKKVFPRHGLWLQNNYNIK